MKTTCKRCNGIGKVRQIDAAGQINWKSCPTCKGTGKAENYKWPVGQF